MTEVTNSTTNLHEYEVVYVGQSGLDDEGVNTLNERFAQIVTTYGGQISSTEPWGRRNLAYPIKKHFSGHYVLQRFQMPAEGTNEVDRFLRLNEDVIRYLIVRTGE
ncbi:MAG: 30S ribosomal protein S6 [Caldilineaceae bacterium]|nr:30S ribosomal protein S6 [Caldilineaceae bacterium]